MNPLSDREFSRYRRLIYDTAGIHLGPAKKALLEARLGRRLRELGMESFSAYYDYVMADATGEELIDLLDRISTNETHFFREPRQFEFLATRLLPRWTEQAERGARPRRIRIWSAGCSTGEEPYSLAMLLLDYFPPSRGWHLEIIGTDLSHRAIAAAEKSVWPLAKAKEIPTNYLKRFMLEGFGSQEGFMKAGPEIRSIVRFHRLNLNDERYGIAASFDLIFCRNVMIYFDTLARGRVLDRLLDCLAPEGYLFVGHAESLSGLSDRLSHIAPTVYALAPAEGLPADRAAGQPREASVIQ
ncbi:MAG TPA: protein-glutamate O-methyltransferase [Candidatus Binatia bacterium]|nr:protein-glutamate O-methyltransferase [Candidatus Binatia bacterium]